MKTKHPFAQQQKDYIYISEFDDISLESFIADFSDLERDPHVAIIAIYISSYGGDAYTLTAMRDMIKSSIKPVATIAIGKAMSCGALLLAAGTPGYRWASKSTEIMMHEVSSGEIGKASDVIQHAQDLDKLNRRILTAFAEDIDISYDKLKAEFKERSNTDWYLTPQEAKKWGMIDTIGLPRIGMIPEMVVLATNENQAKKKKARKAKS